ncbi:MAG: hypothetical protein ACKO2G_15405 [Verrucomicrobiales bacterium]
MIDPRGSVHSKLNKTLFLSWHGQKSGFLAKTANKMAWKIVPEVNESEEFGFTPRFWP